MHISAGTNMLTPKKQNSEGDYYRVFDMLASSGFRFLDYHLGSDIGQRLKYGDTAMYGDGWQKWCDDARNYCFKKGVAFNQTHNLIHNYFSGTAATEELNKMVDRAIEATALLGAQITVMHPVAPPGREDDTQACLTANREFFLRKGELAARHGVYIAVENMLSTKLLDGRVIKRYCVSTRELCGLVEEIGLPNVGICLDAGHLHYMGEPVYEAVMRCRDRLIALHIHDNDRFSDAHIMPYSGTFDWETFFKALYDARYQGFFTLEILHACEKLSGPLQEAMVSQIYALAGWMASRIGGKGEARHDQA